MIQVRVDPCMEAWDDGTITMPAGHRITWYDWDTQTANQAIGTGVLVGSGTPTGRLRASVADAGWLYAQRHCACGPDYAWASGQIGFGAK